MGFADVSLAYVSQQARLDSAVCAFQLMSDRVGV